MHPVIQTFRPGFLLLAPLCVLVGIATAHSDGLGMDTQQEWLICAAILVCATSALISVNTLNEYADFHSGLDLHTERTAFSGGSGALPAHPHYAKATLYAALTMLAITLIIGAGFIIWRGIALLPIALIGIGLIISYTHYLTHRPWLCLIAPGLAFGPLMIMGADVVLRGHYSLAAFCASLPVFFLVNNLLLLNQLPDRVADKNVGRITLPILIGVQGSIKIYGIFLIAAYSSLLMSVAFGVLPVGALLGLAPGITAIRAWQIARNAGENIEKLLPALKLNVLINLLTPALMALGIFFSQ